MDLSQRSDLTQSVHRSSGSFELVLGALLFGLIGLLVDRSAGTLPWFTVAFAIAGFTGACISIYYRYCTSMDQHGADRTARAAAPKVAAVPGTEATFGDDTGDEGGQP